MSLVTNLKYSIYAVYVALMLIGLAYIIGGSAFLSDFSDDGPKEELGFTITFVFTILSGIGMIFFPILGWYEVAKENRRWILTIAIILTVVFILRTITGILEIVRGSFKSYEIEGKLETKFYSMDLSPKKENSFQSIEKQLECCGLRGPSDYTAKMKFIPLSCCRDKKNCNTKEAYWETGCIKAHVNLIEKTTTVLAALDFTAAFFMAVGAGLLFFLRFQLQRSEN